VQTKGKQKPKNFTLNTLRLWVRIDESDYVEAQQIAQNYSYSFLLDIIRQIKTENNNKEINFYALKEVIRGN